MERSPRNLMAITSALLATTAPAVSEAMPTEAMSPQNIAECENAYGTAADGKALVNYKVAITSPRTVDVEASVPNMKEVRPDCNRANVTRYVGMQIYLGKNLVGGKDLLPKAPARGASKEAVIGTSRRLACGKRVTAKVFERADSTQAPGSVTTTRRTSFTVNCASN